MKKFRPKPKKKLFKLLIPVKEFLRDQPGAVKQELNGLIWKLEEDGYLTMPHAEKIEGENMFAIRVIQTGNIRIFYVYGSYDIIYGIHGYVKKTEQIPEKELNQARKILKLLIQGGNIKWKTMPITQPKKKPETATESRAENGAE